MSSYESPPTVADLKAYDNERLARYLKRNASANGGYDISGLFGVEKLSADERHVLATRLW
jgi:hypothetical protein